MLYDIMGLGSVCCGLGHGLSVVGASASILLGGLVQRSPEGVENMLWVSTP